MAYDPVVLMNVPLLEELEMSAPIGSQLKLPSDPESLANCVRLISLIHESLPADQEDEKDKEHFPENRNDGDDDDDDASVHCDIRELEEGHSEIEPMVLVEEEKQRTIRVGLDQGDEKMVQTLREQWGCESELFIENGRILFLDRVGQSEHALDRVLFWLLGSPDVSLEEEDADQTLDESTRAIVRERMRTWVNVLRTFDWTDSPLDRAAVSARWKRLRELSAA